jgi:hypothetical protein
VEICGPGSYLDFRRVMVEKLAAAGRRAADSWLAAGPPVDDLPEPESIDLARDWEEEDADAG